MVAVWNKMHKEIRASLVFGLLFVFTFLPPPNWTHAESANELKQFVQAQQSELKTLERKIKVARKEFKTKQEARRSEWETREQNARHKFNETHQGRENREYIRDFVQRRKEFNQKLTEETMQKMQGFDAQLAALKDAQSNNLKEFKMQAEKGQTPDRSLWPKNANPSL